MSVAGFARRFWSGELGAAGRLLDLALRPAEALYGAGIGVRNEAYARGLLPGTRAQLPVISIGNIAVGGSGKTPFAAWLVQRLHARGEKPALVHGGYAADEPELHRLWNPDVPVIVDRDRVRAAATAHAQGATVLVLDDAFQHRRLRRDLDIVLVTAERWQAETRLLPRGPWREPVSALKRADLVVCVRRTASDMAAETITRQLAASTGRPVVQVHLQADAWLRDGNSSAAPERDAVLVAGIAEPALFAANARSAGARITNELIFADHHDYSDSDVQLISAAAAGRSIVTTAKDWVKLRGRLDGAELYVLQQRVDVEHDATAIEDALDRVLR